MAERVSGLDNVDGGSCCWEELTTTSVIFWSPAKKEEKRLRQTEKERSRDRLLQLAGDAPTGSLAKQGPGRRCTLEQDGACGLWRGFGRKRESRAVLGMSQEGRGEISTCGSDHWEGGNIRQMVFLLDCLLCVGSDAGVEGGRKKAGRTMTSQ